VSTVIEDLNRLESRILARIAELEANAAELEQLRDIAGRLGILERARGDGKPASPSHSDLSAAPDGGASATATPVQRRRNSAGSRGRASGTQARRGGARSATRAAAAEPAGRQSTRRERVLEVVGVEPGISVRGIVAQLGVNRTSLYPVVRQLVSDGLLYKEGPGLWPAAR
jgi:hypothetical protein